MNQTEFTVSRFENRNGSISCRVAGLLHGVRIRKNFKTKEDAAAEKAALEIAELQATAGMRAATTFLSEVQLREAEDAFRRLESKPRSLLFYLEYAFANYRTPEREKPLAEAVKAYLAKKSEEYTRTLLSARQLGAITYELGVLERHFPSGPISQFTPQNLELYLNRGNPSLKTYNNRRGLISTFFKFALQNDWLVANPVEKTPHHRINHRRGSAVTITAERAAELMHFLETFADGKLVPSFALSLFAGIRPCVRFGEITKLKSDSVKLDTGVIRIEPDVSKVRMPRIVTIQPNLAVWLRAYPLDKFAIVPPNTMNLRQVVCKKFGLTHDVLRHTFISMFVGKFRSMGEAALQAGNSESIIRKHYLDLKSTAEAEQFFSILPKRRAAHEPIPVGTAQPVDVAA